MTPLGSIKLPFSVKYLKSSTNVLYCMNPIVALPPHNKQVAYLLPELNELFETACP